MPLVIPPGFAQVTHVMTLTGDPEPMVVTYGVEWTLDAQQTPNATAFRLHGLFAQHLMPMVSNLYQLQHTEVQFGVAVGGVPIIGFYAEIKVGGGVEPPLPQNCAALIKKKTGFGGRRHRGRFYLPGGSELNVDATGTQNAGAIDTYNTKAAAFLLGIRNDPDLLGMSILHTTSIKSPTPPPTPVEQLLCDRKISTQRRRLR